LLLIHPLLWIRFKKLFPGFSCRLRSRGRGASRAPSTDRCRTL